MQDKPLILVAEDDRSIRRIYEGTLQRDYNLLLCADGQEAISAFCSYDNIRLVITDFNMPHRTGRDVIKHIRESARPNTPIILSTTLDPNVAFGDHQYDLYLPKPFDINNLFYCVNTLIESKL